MRTRSELICSLESPANQKTPAILDRTAHFPTMTSMNVIPYRDIHVVVNRERNRLEFPMVPGLPESTFAKMYRELIQKVLMECTPGRFEPYDRALPLRVIPEDLEEKIRRTHEDIMTKKIQLDPNI